MRKKIQHRNSLPRLLRFTKHTDAPLFTQIFQLLKRPQTTSLENLPLSHAGVALNPHTPQSINSGKQAYCNDGLAVQRHSHSGTVHWRKID